MSTFYVHNFGCRANQADGAALAAGLERAGWARVDAAGAADCVVLNTCTVTAAADAEAERAIRRLRREHPQAKIVVTGCYAQRAPQALAAMDGVTLVVGNARKPVLPALMEAAILDGGWVEARQRELPKIVTGDIFERLPLLAAPVLPVAAGDGKSRPTVKVQDGCDHRCAYCVIPFVRGVSRSLPLGQVLERIQSLVASGCQEAVISGINLGQWGRDLDGGPRAVRLRLPDLVCAILEQTALARLRLSSVEPMDWNETLADFMQGDAPRVARHAHLPLQSGSDAVLRRMRRRYQAAHYAERVERLRRRVPLAAIGADVMVGFPGETDAEFDQTYQLVAGLPLTYLHVFSFSSREGTEAARHLEAGDESGAWSPVPEAVAAERGHTLRRLIATKRAAFLATLVGARLPVVTLTEPRPSGCWGLSDNFVKVAVAEAAPANRMFAVEVTGVQGDHLEGRRAIA